MFMSQVAVFYLTVAGVLLLNFAWTSYCLYWTPPAYSEKPHPVASGVIDDKLKDIQVEEKCVEDIV